MLTPRIDPVQMQVQHVMFPPDIPAPPQTRMKVKRSIGSDGLPLPLSLWASPDHVFDVICPVCPGTYRNWYKGAPHVIDIETSLSTAGDSARAHYANVHEPRQAGPRRAQIDHDYPDDLDGL